MYKTDENNVYTHKVDSMSYGTVIVAPPEVPEGHLAVWVSDVVRADVNFGQKNFGKWEVKRDYRDIDLYDKSTAKKVEKSDVIGDLPEHLTELVPPEFGKWEGEGWVVDEEARLQSAKDRKIQEINAERDKELVAGFMWNGHLWDSDDKSKLRITAIVSLATGNPEYSTPYIAKDNAILNLTASQILQFGDAAAAHETKCVFKARQLKDAIEAAKTVDEVLLINWE